MTKPRRGQSKELRKVTVGALETGLLSENLQLLYVDPARREVTWVRPPAAIVELARLGDKKIGRVDCFVKTYKLNQLRMGDGRFWFDVPIEYKPPRQPQLPDNLKKRLEKLRAAQQPLS
jgi:hypothetical protein